MAGVLGFTERGLQGIIAENARGTRTFKSYNYNIEAYADYVIHGTLPKSGAKKVYKAKKSAAPKKDRKQPSRLWKIAEEEVFDLICSNSRKYAAVREAAEKEGSKGQDTIVSIVTAFVTTQVVVAFDVAKTVVALVLLGVVTLGKNIFCRYYGERRQMPKKRPKTLIPASGLDWEYAPRIYSAGKIEPDYTQNDPLGIEGRFAMLRSLQLDFERNRGLSAATSSSTSSSRSF
jgi:hypothetical protein